MKTRRVYRRHSPQQTRLEKQLEEEARHVCPPRRCEPETVYDITFFLRYARKIVRNFGTERLAYVGFFSYLCINKNPQHYGKEKESRRV